MLFTVTGVMIHYYGGRKRGRDYQRLTYRGEEKAVALMRRFDRDHDDKMDFSDFRGYLKHFDRYVTPSRL